MSQPIEHTGKRAKAWTEPLNLSYQRPLERVKKEQYSPTGADVNQGKKLAGLPVNKKEEGEARTDYPPRSQSEIDIEAVARQVYRLMQVDLILEKERTR